MTMNLKFHERGWRKPLERLLCDVKNRLIIVSPYISEEGAKLVCNNLAARTDLVVMTRLSHDSIATGALQIGALKKFASRGRILHLQNLHAKVYVADETRAVITSANLTGNGVDRNYEYGVEIGEHKNVSRIRETWDDLANKEGKTVTDKELQELGKLVPKKQKLTKAETLLRKAILDFERKGATPSLAEFKGMLEEWLKSHPHPHTIHELQDGIRQSHPNACTNENAVMLYRKTGKERNTGKLWKYRLRHAQVLLKKEGKLRHDSNTKKWVPLR